MQAKTHPYTGLSEQEYIVLLLDKDAALMAQAEALLNSGQLIQKLRDDRFTDRQTIWEYRQLIWGSKSERHVGSLAQLDLDATQPELPFDGLPQVESSITKITVPAKTIPEKIKKQPLRLVKPTGRKSLSETLPREYVEILPENYHDGMTRIDAEQTQELDYRPGSFFVRVITRPRFADPKTKSVAIAPMPQRPVHKGIAGAGLLAYILVARFCDHLPYYRQVRMLNRYGENIVNTSTMGSWVKESINLLSVIHSRIKQKILGSPYLQGDETTIKVLDPLKKSGKSQGYLWAYHAPLEKLVLMEYGEGRAADYPDAFLGDFQGVFQTDAYIAYDKLLKSKSQMRHIACWAHARRNFTKALESDKRRATAALDMIRDLYNVEALARKTNADPDQILRLRTEFSIPILEKINQWAQLQEKELNPKSLIAMACRYMLKRWDKLTYYVTDSRILIDNNLLENRFRPVSLGRKNWLFAGNHQSAERSGIIYSILESCVLNNIEPFAYIQDVLTRLPDLMFAPKEKIDELLPGNWKPATLKIYSAPGRQESINAA
ncbi:MAG TPA: IS66 family transposase [Mucilaginibacter sp.]|nr:IS66 family transposase [Mucilaginibacter sp.]